MVRGHLQLNGVGYFLAPFEDGALMHRELIEPFAPVEVTRGQHRQERLATYSATVFGPFTGGFGRDRIPSHRVNERSEYLRFFDATADTRWPTGAYLPLKIVSQTEPTISQGIRGSAVFKDTLYGCWDRADGSNEYGVRTASLSGTTWTGSDAVDTSTTQTVALDLYSDKTHLLLLYASNTNHVILRSSDGTSWAAASTPITTGLLSDAVATTERIMAGMLTSIGGEAVAVIWHESAGTITFFSSADAGDTWADENIDIPSGTGVAGVAVMPGIDGADKLYVGTGSGVWEVDTASSTWTFQLVIPMSGHKNNCTRMTVHQVMLWIPVGVGGNATAGMMRMRMEGDRRVVEIGLGMDALDGVPTALQGNFGWLHSSGPFLYAAYGGGQANLTGRILCHNGEGWHSVAQSASTGSNTAMRWCHVHDENLNFARQDPVSELVDIHEAVVGVERNPNSSTGLTRESSGYIDLPYVHDGMPTIDGIFLQARVDASGLTTTSGEYIEIRYGVNGASRSGTDLGDIVSGTHTLKVASGAGVSARNVGLRATLNRDGGDTTDTPIAHTVEIAAYQAPEATERFRFLIDLQATANSADANVETLIANLEAARDLSTLPAFQYANNATTYVKVRELRFLEQLEGQDGGEPQEVPDAGARRIGLVEVVCDEIVG